MSWLKRFLISWVLPLGIVGLLLLWLLNWEAVDDWWKLRGYTPPLQISTLAEDSTMTPLAKHLLYINHPQLETTNFTKNCPTPEQTIVLGCYHSVEGGIYLYNVTDPRLAGVEEVTAAHEMLHAAYDRLDAKTRSDINTMLTDFYTHDVHDQRMIDTINAYKKTEPNDVVNEMHSVFGTEIGNLPAPLEVYYQRYFTNRSKVVSYANNYEGAFTSRSDKINADQQQLTAQKKTIDSEQSSLQAQLATINSERGRLSALQSSGQIAAYNAAIPGFNAKVDAYNNGVNQLKTDIANYNTLVDAYNQLAGELKSLYQSVQTNLSTQSAQ